MQPLLKGLLSDLHVVFFKPNGFAKRRQRFQRNVDTVMQEIDFQSSQWNSPTDPIRFYVNVSVGFADIPVNDDKPALTGRARIPGLVPGSPPHYDLTPDTYAEIRDSLLEAIPSALAALPEHYTDVRAYALRGSHCVIPIPETWRGRA